ncbi:hypothetical protein TRFO_34712 [Tritrichomonas foetus]|uniref:Uncharacterized protein n=1 Tax=Tritrichomonas foetus TaxID=1144522 RepID=A0A1J4JIC8_9EUKA|nr:hypothetical protein TRFO_34712 [Tritrichomonas foetus]|eukprot:OHS98944.1 hypothetical protein TRFO_34712 [Tritrichomonas foetus]
MKTPHHAKKVASPRQNIFGSNQSVIPFKNKRTPPPLKISESLSSHVSVVSKQSFNSMLEYNEELSPSKLSALGQSLFELSLNLRPVSDVRNQILYFRDHANLNNLKYNYVIDLILASVKCPPDMTFFNLTIAANMIQIGNPAPNKCLKYFIIVTLQLIESQCFFISFRNDQETAQQKLKDMLGLFKGLYVKQGGVIKSRIAELEKRIKVIEEYNQNLNKGGQASGDSLSESDSKGNTNINGCNGEIIGEIADRNDFLENEADEDTEVDISFSNDIEIPSSENHLLNNSFNGNQDQNETPNADQIDHQIDHINENQNNPKNDGSAFDDSLKVEIRIDPEKFAPTKKKRIRRSHSLINESKKNKLIIESDEEALSQENKIRYIPKKKNKGQSEDENNDKENNNSIVESFENNRYDIYRNDNESDGNYKNNETEVKKSQSVDIFTHQNIYKIRKVSPRKKVTVKRKEQRRSAYIDKFRPDRSRPNSRASYMKGFDYNSFDGSFLFSDDNETPQNARTDQEDGSSDNSLTKKSSRISQAFSQENGLLNMKGLNYQEPKGNESTRSNDTGTKKRSNSDKKYGPFSLNELNQTNQLSKSSNLQKKSPRSNDSNKGNDSPRNSLDLSRMDSPRFDSPLSSARSTELFVQNVTAKIVKTTKIKKPNIEYKLSPRGDESGNETSKNNDSGKTIGTSKNKTSNKTSSSSKTPKKNDSKRSISGSSSQSDKLEDDLASMKNSTNKDSDNNLTQMGESINENDANRKSFSRENSPTKDFNSSVIFDKENDTCFDQNNSDLERDDSGKDQNRSFGEIATNTDKNMKTKSQKRNEIKRTQSGNLTHYKTEPIHVSMTTSITKFLSSNDNIYQRMERGQRVYNKLSEEEMKRIKKWSKMFTSWTTAYKVSANIWDIMQKEDDFDVDALLAKIPVSYGDFLVEALNTFAEAAGIKTTDYNNPY